jgi:Zn-dependent protease
MALAWASGVEGIRDWSPRTPYSEALKEMAKVGISINGVLMMLNLLPLPPLDGGRIVGQHPAASRGLEIFAA